MARFDTLTVGVAGASCCRRACSSRGPTSAENNYIDALVDAKLQEAAHRAVRRCAATRRSSAASTSTSSACCRRAEEYDRVHGRRRPEQAREAGRRAARPQGVRRDLGDEVGRAAAGQVVEPGQLQGDVPVLQLAARTRSPATCRSTRWCRSCSAPTAARSRTRRRTTTRSRRDTLKTAENVAQVFMGMRIQCAQCHNHPFDRWTMDDYYGFAAFFAQIGRKQGEDYREIDRLQLAAAARCAHPVGGRRCRRSSSAAPTPDVAGKDRREVLAEWLASPENPYFATQRGQPRLGPLPRPRHRRAGRRRPRQQPGQQPRAARRRWARSSPSTTTTSSSWSATSATRRRISGRRSANETQRRATSATSPTATSAASGPRCCSTASAR